MSRFLLSSTLNTRDLGGYFIGEELATKYNVFLRSDLPATISDKDRELLLSNNIKTIIDLRNDEEVKNKPSAFKGDENFNYHHCKIYGDGRLPESVELVPNSYFEMIDEQKTIYVVLKIILNSNGGILYHCTAGKDRTGVVTALLLLIAGVSKVDILDDYKKSKECLKPLLESFCEENKNVDINIITPKEEYMDRFLDLFHEKYNTVDEYLIQIGLSNNEVIKLKGKIC
ncbi:tyrosine-protein phosphatase [Clostridium sp.]|uniref:tyrosine-protein phosphatase n=1 Tax=Clostridium sp. TaxID=1506 RepID=UPI003F2D3874